MEEKMKHMNLDGQAKEQIYIPIEQTAEQINIKQEVITYEVPNPDEWEEVEEEFVVVDFLGLVNKKTFKSPLNKPKIKVLGLLGNERPILAIDGLVFVGKKGDIPGTGVIMEVLDENIFSSDDEDHLCIEEYDKTDHGLNFFSKTSKKMIMHQGFLSNKKTKELKTEEAARDAEVAAELAEEDAAEEAAALAEEEAAEVVAAVTAALAEAGINKKIKTEKQN